MVNVYNDKDFTVDTTGVSPHLGTVMAVDVCGVNATDHGKLGRTLALRREGRVVTRTTRRHCIRFLNKRAGCANNAIRRLARGSNPVRHRFCRFCHAREKRFAPRKTAPLAAARPALSDGIGFVGFCPFTSVRAVSPHPVLFVAKRGTRSHRFDRSTCQLTTRPGRLCVIPNTKRMSLCSHMDLVPFDGLRSFFGRCLGGWMIFL